MISPGRIGNKIIWNHHPVVLSKAGTWVKFFLLKKLSKTIVSSMTPMEKMAKNINILLQESARLNEVLKVLPGRSLGSNKTKLFRRLAELSSITADDSHPKKHWIDRWKLTSRLSNNKRLEETKQHHDPFVICWPFNLHVNHLQEFHRTSPAKILVQLHLQVLQTVGHRFHGLAANRTVRFGRNWVIHSLKRI